MGSRVCRGFKPSTIYNIQVDAENAFGVGPWSEIYQHTTGSLDTPNAPTGLSLSLTLTKVAGRIINVHATASWTAPTNVNLAGYDLEIYNGASPTGTLEVTIHPSPTALTAKWTDLTPNSDYSARIRARAKQAGTDTDLASAWSLWANASAPTDFSISPPATASVSSKGNDFIPAWSAVSDLAVVGYGIWANTANSFSGSKLLKRVHKPQLTTPIPIGSIDITDGSLTLEYDVPYYFFITSYSGLDNDSTTATSCGATEVVNMSEWQRAFHMPWKMKGLSLVRHVISGIDDHTYTVPEGYVWLITGYYLKANKSATPGPAAHTYIATNSGILDEASEVQVIQRSPQYTNGIFLSHPTGGTGDKVQLYSDEATGSAWFRVKQFKEDVVITTILKFQDITTPYVVPTGKNFVLCYAFGGSPRELEESTDGGSVWGVVLPSEADPRMFSIADDGGVLVFPAGTQLRCSTGSGNAIILIGYEIAAP